jgi:hypothetical protein
MTVQSIEHEPIVRDNNGEKGHFDGQTKLFDLKCVAHARTVQPGVI